MTDVNATSTLLIWSGRNRQQVMLEDVWAVSLESEPLQWRCLYNGTQDDHSLEGGFAEGDVPDLGSGGGAGGGVDESEEEEGLSEAERKKKRKHKKKKRKHSPLPRKGHVAVAVEHEERPLLVSFPFFAVT